jgi:GWxTD domain-containing protein
VYLGSAETARLDRFERIMRPRDVRGFQQMEGQAREVMVRSSWLLADPLWSVQNAEPRTEFLARIAFADIRWSLDEERRGADSDRGDIYIRYGPPNQVLGWLSETNQVMITFWVYNAGLAFAFDKQLHYGTARFNRHDTDNAVVERAKEWQPARWDNIATSRIDSMATQIVRFRSGPDSVEVSLNTRAPVETFQLASVEATPRANLWLYGLSAPTAFLDSVDVGATGRLQWTRKLPAGEYYYRVESMIPSTAVAGRTAGGIAMGPDSTSGFAMRGFGLSDVLLATHVRSGATARRWIDFDPEALLGNLKRGGEISLVWETYELGERNGEARYEVAVTIDRGTSRVGRIAAEIIGRVAGAVGVRRTDDRLALSFERAVPHSNTVPDAITISLGDTPAGSYTLILTITDRVSGRVVQKVNALTIEN